MKDTKITKIEITVESYEVLLMKERGGLSRSWCASCSNQVTMIGLDDACAAGLTAEAINKLAETGRIHLVEIAGEPPLICLETLNKQSRR